jgi:hypothetical protein
MLNFSMYYPGIDLPCVRDASRSEAPAEPNSQADSLKANQPTTNGRAGTHCTDNRHDRQTAYTGDRSILPRFLMYAHTHARTHAPTGTPWFTITGTHVFITSGTSTLMSQHHLHHVDGSTPTAPHCL